MDSPGSEACALESSLHPCPRGLVEVVTRDVRGGVALLLFVVPVTRTYHEKAGDSSVTFFNVVPDGPAMKNDGNFQAVKGKTKS